MASKSVKFSKERGSRRTDSGVGSFSDPDSRGSTPDRSFADYESQRNSIPALQEALASMRDERDQWRRKARELDADLSNAKKELKETEARWRGLYDRNEILDQEKRSLVAEKKALQDRSDRLDADLDLAYRTIDSLRSAPPVVMSGAMPPSPTEKKLHRSSSRKEKSRSAEERDRAAEKVDKEKLKARFERSDESDAARTTSTTKTRRRRDSYIEPLGQSAPRPVPATAPVPPSPTRLYTNYATASMQEPLYTTIREPVLSQVPRTPTVIAQTYTYDHLRPYNPEDGNYHIHPLPPTKSSRERR